MAALSGIPAPFRHRVRVRYAETDRMGVVHHGSYVLYFEEARTEFLRSLGFSYRQLEDEGTCLAITELSCRYLGFATFDDFLTVEVTLTRLTLVRMALAYRVTREDGTPTAEGSTTLACVDKTGKVTAIPEKVARALRVALAERN